MTRDQAKVLFWKAHCSFNDPRKAINRAVGILFDVIESKTCISCKHFELDKFEVNRGTCRNKNTPTRDFMVDCDYGCNRYEPKETK